jgi:hypothetical protein
MAHKRRTVQWFVAVAGLLKSNWTLGGVSAPALAAK